MDVPLINRREEDYIKKRGTHKRVFRNLNPQHHPFQQAREYTRALNATKLDRVFAKPFIGALSGCVDSIWRLSTVPNRLPLLISGDCAGEIRVWNTSRKTLEWKAEAHEGFVRGVSSNSEGELIVSCGSDCQVRLWSIHNSDAFSKGLSVTPKTTFTGKSSFMDLDWQWQSPKFATAGEGIELWDLNRGEPIHKYKWGFDTCNVVKFNRVEENLFCHAASDRSIVLTDTRTNSNVKKLILRMSTNSVCWNPMEAFTLTTASEDTNLYTFDIRHMEKAKFVHEDHLNAVMSIDYSPIGNEFVTGSYDKTVRIFKNTDTHSREVYHAKRMQRVFDVKFSLDSSFVFSGSDDTNVRIWKANASEKLGTLTNREQEYMNYSEKLKEKYKFMPEIRKISRHRHLPRQIYQAKKQRQVMKKAKEEKNRRIETHSKTKVVKEPKGKQVIVSKLD